MVDEQSELGNEKLWEKLQIDFRLEAFRFPDNKIYGTIQIIPESSRKLIKKFFLVVNEKNSVEFPSDFEHIAAAGFRTNRKNPSAYIKAIPINSKWEKTIKTSKICYFVFIDKVYALSPTISFDLIDDKIILKVNWYHIGDKHAQKYILYLDNAQIQHIRQKSIDDAFEICIHDFKAGEKHTFQLAAKLNNGKETYRSDLLEFIVPGKESISTNHLEFITISNEPPPPNLPAYIASENDKVQEDFIQKPEENPPQTKSPEQHPPRTKTPEQHPVQTKSPEQHLVEMKKSIKLKQKRTLNTCCDHLPHETFPGLEHYFNLSRKISYSEESDDDDDDVIINDDV